MFTSSTATGRPSSACWSEAMVPALNEIVQEVAGQLQTVSIDVIAYLPIAEHFKVRIIPTLLIFKPMYQWSLRYAQNF
jgi:thioredoxin-like negative regulator of GroEL